MAKDEKKSMMERMSEGRLPATKKSDVPATRQPRDPSAPKKVSETAGGRGKTPEEVLGEALERRESQAPAVVETEGDIPFVTRKVGEREISLDQIAARELDKILADAETQKQQYSWLNKKHTDLIEGLANQAIKPAERKEEAQAVRLTPQQILDRYLPYAKMAAQEGYLEAEVPDAYPNWIASQMYFREWIEALIAKVAWLEQRAVAADNDQRARDAERLLNSAIDKVAALDAPIYKLLEKKDYRKKFIDWLYKEVDPRVKDVNENTIRTNYLAFNGDLLLEIRGEKKEPAPRRANIQSDGGNVRPGGADPEPEAEDHNTRMRRRMTEQRLGPEQ